MRVRLVKVPGFAATDGTFSFVNLPPEEDFTPSQATIGPVVPLPSCSAQQVEVCGIIPAPQQNDCLFGVGIQVYAVLEQCDGTPAQCADPANADLWLPVDTIRVTEGEWPVVAGFNGPGGGTNQDRRGGRGRNAPYMLDSLEIVGPATVSSSGSGQFHANAMLKKASGATKTLTNVKVQWTASMFTIDSTGLFQAGAVTVSTPVTISCSYTFGGVTKTQEVQVNVDAPTMAQTAKTQIASHVPAKEMSDDDTSVLADADSGPMPRKKNRPPKPQKISLSVSSTNINEGGSAMITVTAKKASTIPVTVNYSLSGTARLNTHYVICGDPGEITIPAGAASASVRLTAIANDLNLGTEAATVTLVPGAGYKIPRRAPTASINITNAAAPLCP